MRKVFTIKKDNYLKHLNDPDIDYNTGLTRFKCKDKNCFVWSYRFFLVSSGLYQVKARLGHMKENWSFCGSLETIFEHIVSM